MHVHVRQHFTKIFCLCRFRCASYETITYHQNYEDCPAKTTNVYEVDKNSYQKFLRHIRWKSATLFEECTPTTSNDSRYPPSTDRLCARQRRPVKERLVASRVNHIQEVRAEVTELKQFEQKAAQY